MLPEKYAERPLTPPDEPLDCPECGGTGEVFYQDYPMCETCKMCEGTGNKPTFNKADDDRPREVGGEA